jgi:signal transduction histidine kinase
VFERHTWWMIALPVLVIGTLELLSDTVLDEALPFPLDTAIIVASVAVLSLVYWRFGVARVRRLGTALDQRSDELEQRNATARALHRVSVATTGLGDVDGVLALVVGQARSLLSADVALLLTTAPDGEVVVRAASDPAGVVDPRGDRPGPDAVRFLPPEFAAVQLSAPLRRGTATIGQLFVGSRTTRAFSVDDIEALSSLANQASIALENADLQARLRELAVVAERERIAREMHDGLAQMLGYVNTKSQAAESFLEAGKVDDARGQLAELSAAARSVYVDVREAILGLRSPILPDVGLVAAVEEYARRFAEASKLVVNVEATPQARALALQPDVASSVFRIAQEALTNVRKHAAARRVDLGFRVEAGTLIVTVDDDGRGIGGGKTASGEWPHYGLVTLRERAATIGGELTVDRPDGGTGTRIRLAVPVVPAPDAERTALEAV